MERIFWAECPACHGKFYCSHREMRHAGVKLLCPFCHARFLPDEAASLDERDKPPPDGPPGASAGAGAAGKD